MRNWPPITEQELLERQALDDEQLITYNRKLWSTLGPREFEPSVIESALGYPWERPTASFILRGEDVQLLDDIAPAKRTSVVKTFTEDRHPLLSFGGNGAPGMLATKFAHFPEEADRTVLVLAGELHDFDVGPAPHLTVMGFLPATLFSSPGTAVRAAITWATAAQVTQLTWSETNYRLVRLDDAHFVMDEADVEVDQIFAYLHRFGSFCVDGSPVALAAIPARSRTATALTQKELLDMVARMLIRSDAEDLIRALFESESAVAEWTMDPISSSSQQLRSSWTPYPTARSG